GAPGDARPRVQRQRAVAERVPAARGRRGRQRRDRGRRRRSAGRRSGSPGMNVFECRDLSYAYLERYPALDNVSLSVAPGETIALLGANGCGKSALLKVVDGLLFADSGTFTAFGEEVTEDKLEDEQFNRGFRARVGFVFQNSDAQVFSPSVREE